MSYLFLGLKDPAGCESHDNKIAPKVDLFTPCCMVVSRAVYPGIVKLSHSHHDVNNEKSIGSSFNRVTKCLSSVLGLVSLSLVNYGLP